MSEQNASRSLTESSSFDLVRPSTRRAGARSKSAMESERFKVGRATRNYSSSAGDATAMAAAMYDVGDVLHEVPDMAPSTLRAGGAYLGSKATKIGKRAARALKGAARRARRVERVASQFVSAYSVSLLLLSTGLGMLTLRAFKSRTPRHLDARTCAW